MEKLYTLNPKALWAQFKKEHFAFWMLCAYLLLQYWDPMEIYRHLAIIPWDKVVLGLAVLALPMDPRRRWARDATNIWMTLFLGVILLSSALAIYPSISWANWFNFVNWYVIYFLIISIVTTKERCFIFLALFLLANFKLSFFGGRTWLRRGFGFVDWGIEGPPGFFQNSADLSMEMLMVAPIAFELAMFLKPYVRRVTHWFLMLGAVTGAMTVLGASSRGAQVALAFQGGWIAIQRKLKIKVLIAIALIAGLGYVLLPAAEKARFSSAGTDKTSIQRLDYWRAGVRMIEDHPFLGVGYYNFLPVYGSYANDKLWNGKPQLPHNIFIQVGTDAGLTGLGIFLILIFRNLKVAREIRRTCKENADAPPFALPVARALTITTWGFVIAGQFNTVAYYPFFWFNLALTVSLANVVRGTVEERALEKSARPPSGAYAGMIASSRPSEGGVSAPRSTP